MTVNPLDFVTSMTKHWQQPDIVNEALKHSWQQQAETFNHHINGTNTHPWSVLYPPTGTGKTQGLALYCSMISQKNHAGVLIVVRMRTEANDLAEHINKLANTNVAIAVHGDSEHEQSAISASPILVITHSAYVLAVQSTLKLDNYVLWKSGERKLTVIDERLGIIKHDQVQLDELRQLRGHIPHTIVQKHPLEITVLDDVIKKLESLAGDKVNRIRLTAKDFGKVVPMAFDGLREALKTIPLDSLILHATSPEERQRLASRHKTTLASLAVILANWSLYASKGTLHTLSTGRVIMPNSLKSAVIMDATAAFDPVYKLLGESVQFINPPTGIRSYQNVTLHVSTGHKVGKHSLAKRIQKEAATFITELQHRIKASDKLLICTHKASKSHLEGYGDNIAVANWGAIDGKNDWRNYNAVAIFGLSYLDRIQPEVSLIALQEWAGRNFSKAKYEQTIDELYWAHIAVTVIQAINRVRCRTAIDEKGNCLPTDVYLLLPATEQAKNITRSIAQAMPEIKSTMWASRAAKKRVRRSSYEAPLLSHLQTLGRGTHLAKDIRLSLGIPDRTFEKLVHKLKDKSNLLYDEITAAGFSYQVEGVGRGAKSWFVTN